MLGCLEPAKRKRLPGGEVGASQCIWVWRDVGFRPRKLVVRRYVLLI
jgi:hypothetical protein